MNFRERLEQSRDRLSAIEATGSNAELEENYACDYFATDNIKSLPACLDLRLQDNKHKAIPYSNFIEIDFDSDNGIEITTTTKKVIISGRYLGRLYDFLVAYRVRFIMANSGSDMNEEGLFVSEIKIEEV